jgi:hypothetical protein
MSDLGQSLQVAFSHNACKVSTPVGGLQLIRLHRNAAAPGLAGCDRSLGTYRDSANIDQASVRCVGRGQLPLRTTRPDIAKLEVRGEFECLSPNRDPPIRNRATKF